MLLTAHLYYLSQPNFHVQDQLLNASTLICHQHSKLHRFDLLFFISFVLLFQCSLSHGIAPNDLSYTTQKSGLYSLPNSLPLNSINTPSGVQSTFCVLYSSSSHHYSNYFSSHFHYFLYDHYNCFLLLVCSSQSFRMNTCQRVHSKCDFDNATALIIKVKFRLLTPTYITFYLSIRPSTDTQVVGILTFQWD